MLTAGTISCHGKPEVAIILSVLRDDLRLASKKDWHEMHKAYAMLPNCRDQGSKRM